MKRQMECIHRCSVVPTHQTKGNVLFRFANRTTLKSNQRNVDLSADDQNWQWFYCTRLPHGNIYICQIGRNQAATLQHRRCFMLPYFTYGSVVMLLYKFGLYGPSRLFHSFEPELLSIWAKRKDLLRGGGGGQGEARVPPATRKQNVAFSHVVLVGHFKRKPEQQNITDARNIAPCGLFKKFMISELLFLERIFNLGVSGLLLAC